MMKEQVQMEILSEQVLVRLFLQFSSGNNKQIKDIEAKLNHYSDHKQFLSTLLNVPRVENVSQYVAKMAVVHTQAYARKVVEGRKQNAINMMTQELLKYISQSGIKFELRQHVAATIQYIMSQDRNQIILTAFIPNFIDLLKQAINQPDNNINFQYIGLFGQIIINNSSLRTEQLVKFISETMLNFVNLNIRLIRYVQSNENMYILQKGFQLSKIYSQVIKGYLKKFLQVNSSIVSYLYDQRVTNLLAVALSLSLPNNSINSPIFYISQQNNTVIELFHTLKANYISIFTQCIRIMSAVTNNSLSNFAEYDIIKMIPQFIVGFAKSLTGILDKVPYYKIHSTSKVKIIQQIYLFLTVCLRTNLFYSVFLSLKQQLLQCLYKTLALSPNDIHNYHTNPSQFLNYLNQVIDMNASAGMRNKKKIHNNSDDDDDQEPQMYGTMKTSASILLDTICNYIDGTLTEIFQFSINVLEDFLNTQYSKNLLLIVLCILRTQTKERTDLHLKLSAVVCKMLKDMQLPKKSTQQSQSIQFSLVLFTLVRYFPFIESVNDTILQKTFTLAQQIIQCPNIHQVPKLITYDLIICSLHFEEASIYCIRFLFIFNNILNNPENGTQPFLQCLSYFFKFNDFEFKSNPQIVMDTVSKIVNLLLYEHKKGNEGNLARTTGAWNVLLQIVDSIMMIAPKSMQNTIPNQVQQPIILLKIEQNLLPLLQLVDGNNTLHYEQKLFQIISKCIKKLKKISEIQLKVLTILPKVFYSQTPHKYLLHDFFQLLQLIIFYGSNLLSQNLQLIRNIILMANDSLNQVQTVKSKITQADNCEGALIIQSLIISCGDSFDSQIWVILTTTTTKRLHNPPIQYDFLRTNIVTNLSLILMYAHKFFSPQDNDMILNQVLKEYSCFSYKKSSKIFIFTLCQLINLISLDFIRNRFVQILDCLITLLEISQMKKDQIFSNSELNAQQVYFSKISKSTVNTISNLNELEYFRSNIQKLRQTYPQIYQSAYNNLPQTKKGYFRNLLSTVKVGQESRIILRIKK